MAHRTHSPLKAAADASVTAEGHDVVLLLTPEQLLRKRNRCFRLSAGCPARLAQWVSVQPYCARPCAIQHVRRLPCMTNPQRYRESKRAARQTQRCARSSKRLCLPACAPPYDLAARYAA